MIPTVGRPAILIDLLEAVLAVEIGVQTALASRFGVALSEVRTIPKMERNLGVPESVLAFV